MSNSMGIASVFVLSSVLLSPLAMAEESSAFVARNVAVAQAQQDASASLEQTASKASEKADKDS